MKKVDELVNSYKDNKIAVDSLKGKGLKSRQSSEFSLDEFVNHKSRHFENSKP